jgi:hypothetical protein
MGSPVNRCRRHRPEQSWVHQQLRNNAIESVVFGAFIVGFIALGVWIWLAR